MHSCVVVGARATEPVIVLLVSPGTAADERLRDHLAAVWRTDHLGNNPKVADGIFVLGVVDRAEHPVAVAHQRVAVTEQLLFEFPTTIDPVTRAPLCLLPVS